MKPRLRRLRRLQVPRNAIPERELMTWYVRSAAERLP